MLEREKSRNKKLLSQLDKARAEVVSLKSSSSSSELHVPRSVLQQLDSGAVSATTSHNIPHRMITVTNRQRRYRIITLLSLFYLNLYVQREVRGVPRHHRAAGCMSPVPRLQHLRTHQVGRVV